MRHDGGSQPNGRHMDAIGITQYEPGFDGNIVKTLERLGHKLVPQPKWCGGFHGWLSGYLA